MIIFLMRRPWKAGLGMYHTPLSQPWGQNHKGGCHEGLKGSFNVNHLHGNFNLKSFTRRFQTTIYHKETKINHFLQIKIRLEFIMHILVKPIKKHEELLVSYNYE